MSEGNTRLEYDKIPVRMLNVGERLLLSQLLNTKLIREAEKDHVPRDFRGLGQLMGFEATTIKKIEQNSDDFTEQLLVLWEQDETNTIGTLLSLLERMERFDVIDDLMQQIEKRLPQLLRKLSRQESASSSTDVSLSFSSQSSHEETTPSLEIVSRKEWNAVPATSLNKLTSPVDIVIIHQTTTSDKDIASLLRTLQKQIMQISGSFDIGYNFIIDENGIIYEGTGWDKACGHHYRLSWFSYAFAFVGDFNEIDISSEAMDSLDLLLKEAITIGKLRSNYGLYGLCDVEVMHQNNPGSNLMKVLKTLPTYQALGDVFARGKY